MRHVPRKSGLTFGLSVNRVRRWLTVAAGITVVTAVACQPLPGNTVSRAPATTTAGKTTTQQAQPAASNQAPVEARVVALEWKYELPTAPLPIGRPVTLILENKGATAHDFTIPALKIQLVAQPGQTAKETFTFDKPGAYDYECIIPGHKEAGMKGMLVVGDAKAPAGKVEDPKAPASAQPAVAPAKVAA